MRQYDHQKIEKKWQKEWEKKKAHVAKDKVAGKKNEYLLVEFPYPSGNLHVGHWYAFAIPDIYARFRRAQGKNVLYPMGFDAFGLPAENAAIKNKLNPRKWTLSNIAYMKKQLASMGASFDWSREVSTIDPEYYKWTQWQFLQFFKKGLAYQKETPANWCPKDKTVLANEQVVNGRCERCGTEVEQRMMLQWNLKITDYADRLIDDLAKLDWPEQIKESQRNWIGRSEGAEILFPLQFQGDTNKLKYVLLHGFTGSVSDYDWLKSELEKLGHEVIVPYLPHTSSPNEKEWVEAVLNATTYDKKTVLFGYSLGAVATMKALEKLDTKIAALVLAGGFVDPKFKDHSRNFEEKFSWKFDPTAITSKVGHIHLLHDTTDTAISEEQAKRLSEFLGVPLTKVEAQKPHFCGDKELVLLNYLIPSVTVFTTRPDTLFGATYIVLAPEHPWVTAAIYEHKMLANNDEVRKYIEQTKKKTDLERQESREKTGVELKGVKAINPATGEKISVYVADYVLPHYGTGAIMAVPAHDERDFEFARKFGLPIKQVIVPYMKDDLNPVRPDKKFTKRTVVYVIVLDPTGEKFVALRYKARPWLVPVTGGVEDGEDPQEAALREAREETGYQNMKVVGQMPYNMYAEFFAAHKDVNRLVFGYLFKIQLTDMELKERDEHEVALHDVEWLPLSQLASIHPMSEKDHLLTWMRNGDQAYTGDGVLMNSGQFNNLQNSEAKKAIIEKFGRAKKTYRLRDWGVSRQRYWGVPIPIIHCEECGAVPVPDKDLPVKLPEVKDYLPAGDGKSPLAKATKWVNVKCPKCKGKAKRETDTLDTFVDSSWYFLRYTDPKNKKVFADKKKQKLWMPVDLYSGGAEHTTMHLLYSRFWHKALYDLKLVGGKEPYTRRMNRGLILGPDGQKMSKSKGNVIDPDAVVEKLGADTVRLYLAFIGPYNEPGSYPWNPDSIVGVRRFLERVWRLHNTLTPTLSRREREEEPPRPTGERAGVRGDVERALHQTIKKVGEDCAELKFNTAIAQMMTFLNIAEQKGITKQQYATFVRILAPFAPHITEELWEMLGNKKSVHLAPWPKFDKKKLVADTITIAVQINGKTRGEAKVPQSASKEEQEKAAREAVADRLTGQTVTRTIVVPGRLVNFVIS